ncbi:MAG: MFS transporter [Microcystaceae cyanobacterium]
MESSSENLHWTTKLAYGSGDFGPALTANILVFYLLFFLTNVAGLPPGLAGSVLMIGKISDAVNDPFVGVLSDRTRSRWGRRLPWILMGIIPFGLFYFLQWIVPQFSTNQNTNNWGLFAYYILIGVLFNIAYTMVNLPYTALTPELTQDYNERTRLNSFRFAFSIGGSILSLILAGVIFNTYEDETNRFTILGVSCTVLGMFALLWATLRIQERGKRSILSLSQKHQLGLGLMVVGLLAIIYGLLRLIPFSSQWVGGTGTVGFIGVFSIIMGGLVILSGLTFYFAVVESHLAEVSTVDPVNSTEETIPFVEQLRIVFRNKPFLFVIGIYLCSWLGVQLTASILIYFVVSWMGLTAELFPLVALAVQGTALVMLFIWQKLSDRFDKKIVYIMGMVLWIVSEIGLFLLQPGQVFLMFILAFLAGCGVSVAYLIPWSMIPDVIELDELETGKRREGIFYAFMVLLQKFGLALGLFLVGIALEASGFIEQVPGQPVPVQPDSALLAIRIAIAPLPAAFLIIGVILAYFYPITKAYHQEIRLKLQERKN